MIFSPQGEFRSVKLTSQFRENLDASLFGHIELKILNEVGIDMDIELA